MKIKSLYLFDVCIAQIWQENEFFQVRTFEYHLINSTKYLCFKHAIEAGKKLIAPDLRDKIIEF